MNEEAKKLVDQLMKAFDENAKEAGLDESTMIVEYEDEYCQFVCNYESINTMIIFVPKTMKWYETVMYGHLFGPDVCEVGGRVCKPYKNGMAGVLSDASIWYTG